MARTFWFKPAKRDQATDVSATPNARPIAFQQVVPELFRSFIKFLRVTFLLALCWHFGFVKFVTPYPSEAWSWRRGSELNRRIQLLQSRALPLGYPAFRDNNIKLCVARKFAFRSRSEVRKKKCEKRRLPRGRVNRLARRLRYPVCFFIFQQIPVAPGFSKVPLV